MPIDIVGDGPSIAGDLAQFARHFGTEVLGAFGRGHVVGAIHPQRKLVAAQPCDEIARPHGLAQDVGGAHQNLVTRLVAQPVVHRLEVVEIGEQQRSRLILTIEPVDVAGHLLDNRRRVAAGKFSQTAF